MPTRPGTEDCVVPVEPNPELDQLIAEVAELRPLPAVAVRALEIAEGEQFSAHELAQAISADQALTAYYGFPRRITTVRDAVVLLGFRAVRSATLASCVIDTLPGGTVMDPTTAWRYSVTVGLLAEVLSRASQTHQDEAFTAGVLHNIGRLALDQHRSRELTASRALARQQGLPLMEAQRLVLGYTDADLGGALALHWNFPEALAEAVAHHHLDVNALPDPKSVTAFVVRARLFARANGINDGFDVPEEAPQAEAEWNAGRVSTALNQSGGIDGILERVSAFMQSTRG